MMMIPRRRNDFDLFDEIFDDPFFSRVDTKLMRTDIKEKKDSYVVNVDLPGYEKEDIKIEINNGYLTVTAEKTNSDEEKEEGRYIRKERYSGQCSRSFYVGDNVKDTDVKASFKNGILTLEFPKEKHEEIEEKKYIPIE
mgnify:FL=1